MFLEGGADNSNWWPQRDSNPCLSHARVFANDDRGLSAISCQESHATETRSVETAVTDSNRGSAFGRGASGPGAGVIEFSFRAEA